MQGFGSALQAVEKFLFLAIASTVLSLWWPSLMAHLPCSIWEMQIKIGVENKRTSTKSDKNLY
jgi:hypothetical protein